MPNLRPYESDKNVPIKEAPAPVHPKPLKDYPVMDEPGVLEKDTTPEGYPLEP